MPLDKEQCTTWKCVRVFVWIITAVAYGALQKTGFGTTHNSHYFFWKNVNMAITARISFV